MYSNNSNLNSNSINNMMMCDYNNDESPKCAICNTSSLLRCAKCKTIFYCSSNHQHLDWPKHRKECRILAKQNHMMMMNNLLTSDVNNSSNSIMNNVTQQQHQQQQQQVVTSTPIINTNTATNEYQQNNTILSPSTMNNTNFINDLLQQNGVGSSSSPSIPLQPSSPQSITQDQMIPSYHQQFVINRNNFMQNNQQSSFSENSCKIGENFFSSEQRYEELCRNIINDMNNYGLSVVDDFLGMEKGLQILNEVHKMYAAGVFQDGQLVSPHSTNDTDLRTIRGDKITWVKGTEAGCTNIGYLINQIDAVVCLANKMHDNGVLGKYDIKERTKAMVACYPGSGSHYVTHVDNPNKDGRVITAIYYLNLNWDTKRSGGILRIFPENGGSVADIEPKFDRIIFFWSDRRNPHEVQPAHRTRYAITVWYFDANERLTALNRCKKYGNDVNL